MRRGEALLAHHRHEGPAQVVQTPGRHSGLYAASAPTGGYCLVEFCFGLRPARKTTIHAAKDHEAPVGPGRQRLPGFRTEGNNVGAVVFCALGRQLDTRASTVRLDFTPRETADFVAALTG